MKIKTKMAISAPLVILSIALTGCATIITGVKLPVQSVTHITCSGSPSAAILTFDRTDIGSAQGSIRAATAEFQAAVLSSLKATGCFKKVESIPLPATYLEFKDRKSLSDFIRKLNNEPHSDYVIDVYHYYYIDSPNEEHFILPFLVEGLLHVFTLGLVPMWLPLHSDQRASILANSKSLSAKLTVTNSASSWTWSPFIFRSDEATPSKKSDEFDEITAATLANKISDWIKNVPENAH